jgi:Tfp pilus assembly protein PilV
MPTLTNGVMYSKFTAVTFRGLANVSVGYATKGPNKVNIVRVGYKLNSNPWKSMSIAVPAPQVTWSFAVALSAGLNTIQFNATDSKGNVNTTATYQVLVDSAAPKMGFSTANNAIINAGTPVTAWAYDLEGDFNASSVVVKANNVALPAADVVVTGSNTLGANSSFAIAITLTAGTWTLTLSASDYAGNTGSAASSIKVTVNVPQDQTFTSSGAAQCTVNGAFTGDCITFTNNAATAQTATFIFVWYNAAGQVVAITGSSATVAAGGQYSASSAFSAAGSYTVQAFVISANNSALSVQYPATITIP